MSETWVQLTYLVAAVCFILALKGLSSPKFARRGNWLGAFGATLAVVVTLVAEPLDHMPWILLAIAIGTAFGVSGCPPSGDDGDATTGGALQRSRWRCRCHRRDSRVCGQWSG